MNWDKKNMYSVDLFVPTLFFPLCERRTVSNEDKSLDTGTPLASENAPEVLENKMKGTSWSCRGSEWDYVSASEKYFYDYIYLLKFGTEGTGTIKYRKEKTCYVYDKIIEKWHVTHHLTVPVYVFEYKALSVTTLQLQRYKCDTSSSSGILKTISKVTDNSLYVNFLQKYFIKE